MMTNTSNSRRLLCTWLTAIFVAAWVVAAPSAESIATHPYAGLTYIDRTATSPRAIHMHIVQIDLTTPGIRFKLSSPRGPMEVIRQPTLEYLKSEHAQVAINAHFFLPWPSAIPEAEIIGIGASEGRVYSAFEVPAQSYAIVADSPGLNIDAGNRATVVHWDSTQRDGAHVREPVTLWNTVSGSAQIVTDGVVSTPTYKDALHPDALLTPGGPNRYSNAHSWYDAVTARTAIGLSRDARMLTLFTVDARGGSLGMRLAEVAEILIKDYGVWNALNLDGGGSTSLAMEDPVTHVPFLANVSSDNPGGRAVGTNLAVFARPVARPQ
jgi:exopolysaccharide biosynthesis protein